MFRLGRSLLSLFSAVLITLLSIELFLLFFFFQLLLPLSFCKAKILFFALFRHEEVCFFPYAFKFLYLHYLLFQVLIRLFSSYQQSLIPSFCKPQFSFFLSFLSFARLSIYSSIYALQKPSLRILWRVPFVSSSFANVRLIRYLL